MITAISSIISALVACGKQNKKRHHLEGLLLQMYTVTEFQPVVLYVKNKLVPLLYVQLTL